MIRQLGNLAHCTSPKDPNYLHYYHLLEQLATLRFGLVLVELCRTMEDNHEALDLLQELTHTLLSVVHIDHPQEVGSHAASAVASILDEFDTAIPTTILDEVLSHLAAGPFIMVTNPAAVEAAAKIYNKKNPAKASTEALPPNQIQQTNPSYLVAANAIRKVGEKVASPISSFLNGLWNGDANIVEQSSISTDETSPNIWSTIYELNKVAPQILTTVIGTVASSLTAPEEDVRVKVVKLLGKLFFTPNSKIGSQFGPCFREWLKRHVDVSNKVRSTMVKYLVSILSNMKTDLMEETTTALQSMISADPDANIRIEAIHQICDLAYKSPSLVASSLLLTVGDRVSSKNKTERKDALTGLAQIYHKHYIFPRLKHVESGGDDCAIEIVMDALHKGDSMLDEKFQWIAAKNFECACLRDDFDLQSRVIQIVDEVFLGRDTLTGTSCAVGLAIIMDSIGQSSNAYVWMTKIFSQRAALQVALKKYLDARASVRKYKPDTEESLTADAHAMELLEHLSGMIGILSEESEAQVLDKIHTARDNHIFKILATIANATHSLAARKRALDELPKRTKSLGDPAMNFVRAIARRTAMGNFVNIENIHHVILLAQECLAEDDYKGCSIFLACIKTTIDFFPSICSRKEDFGNLLELFTECRGITNAKRKSQANQLEIVTTIGSIVASAAGQANQNGEIDNELFGLLLDQCTRGGNAEQARNAVQTIVALLVDKNEDEKKQKKAFTPLLNALLSPSVLSNDASNTQTVGALAALTTLVESMPSLFEPSEKGVNALHFALETILLGKRHEKKKGGEKEEHDIHHQEKDNILHSERKRRQNQSPGTKQIFDDENLSKTCRLVCASIEFLASHIRSVLIAKNVQKVCLENLCSKHVTNVFNIFNQILEDQGLPPCSLDKPDCRSRQDRAAIRECVSIQMFRLCDTRLNLVDKYLNLKMWHILSATLLDDEKRVREKIMAELGLMLTGAGPYSFGGPPQPANLRFVAMVVFCVDGESHAIANGNAANVGKACHAIKAAAKMCVVALRQTTEATLHRCRAVGQQAEINFDRVLKKKIMPEYCVPYAIHLLSLRQETPSAGGIVVGISGSSQLIQADLSDDDIDPNDDSAHQKMLRKRLKWLFEPLVLSLGDGADNITFLLRMTEIIGNQFQPRDSHISSTYSEISSTGSVDSDTHHPVSSAFEQKTAALLMAKMKTVCAAAREVLLSFVKKDINLAPYPGQIEVPISIFQKVKRPLSRNNVEEVKKLSPFQKQKTSDKEPNSHKRGNDKRDDSKLENPKGRRRSDRLKAHESDDVENDTISIASKAQRNESLNSSSSNSRTTTIPRDSVETQSSLEDGSTRRSYKRGEIRNRDSIESTNTDTITILASQDSNTSPSHGVRQNVLKSRVTFSPEIEYPTFSIQVESPSHFDGMSPIQASPTPSYVGLNSASNNDTEGKRRKSRRVMDSRKQDKSSHVLSKSVLGKVINPRSIGQDVAADVAAISNTQSSAENIDSPNSTQQSRSTKLGHREMHQKKKPVPVKIKVGLSQSSMDSSVSSSKARSQPTRKRRRGENEFDFIDESQISETSKKSAKVKSKRNTNGNSGKKRKAISK
jgi:hypothetical protein